MDFVKNVFFEGGWNCEGIQNLSQIAKLSTPASIVNYCKVCSLGRKYSALKELIRNEYFSSSMNDPIHWNQFSKKLKNLMDWSRYLQDSIRKNLRKVGSLKEKHSLMEHAPNLTLPPLHPRYFEVGFRRLRNPGSPEKLLT